MAYFVEVKRTNGKKHKVVATIDSTSDKTPEPTNGGDIVLRSSREVVELIRLFNGNMHRAKEIVGAIDHLYEFDLPEEEEAYNHGL